WNNLPLAEHFGLVYEPLSAKDLAQANAKSGYQLTVVVRGGLPVGPLNQTLVLNTSLKVQSPPTLTIYGDVVTDVSLAGPREFNRQRNILSLGAIAQGNWKTSQLTLSLLGNDRHRAAYKVAKVVPADLKVKLGKPYDLPGSHAVQVPINIEVPTTAQQVALLS